MNFDVFISYPHQDKPTADAACAILEATGIRCWIAPRDISPGAEWAASIVEAIDHCRAFVLIFSSHANRSKQVHREVQQAFDREIPVLPLRVENVPPAGTLAYFVGPVHWLDALAPPLEAHLQRLAEIVCLLLEKMPQRTERHADQDAGNQGSGRNPAEEPEGQLNDPELNEIVQQAQKIKSELEKSRAELQLALRRGEYVRAGNLTDKQIPQLEKGLKSIADDLFSRGREQSDDDRAIRYVSEAIQLDSSNEHAFLERAWRFITTKLYDLAIQDATEAIRLNPQSWTFLVRAMGNDHKGNYQSAIQDYSEAIRLDPRNFYHALESRAEIYDRIGDRDRAVQDWGAAIAVAKEELKGKTKSGEVAFAMRYLTETLGKRARALEDKGDYDAAIDHYSELIHLRPESDWYFIMRAGAYERKQDFVRAMGDYNEAIRLAPNSYYNFQCRASLYKARGNFDRAIEDYSQAIKLRPGYFLRDRAELYKAKGDYDRAIADHTELIRLETSAPNVCDRGRLYCEIGNYALAIQDCDEALRLDPKLAVALWIRGLAKRKLGDEVGANDDAEKARAIDANVDRDASLRSLAASGRGS